MQFRLICSQNEPVWLSFFFSFTNTESKSCSQICQQFNKCVVYNLSMHQSHSEAFSTYAALPRSREHPEVVLSARKSTANVWATVPPPCYNSLKEERGGEKRRKHDLRNLKPIKMAKNWRTVIVCTLQVMQTLSQIFQWLYRWMPWGPSQSPVLAASRSPYLKSKQSTINLFERPLWLLMYPKLEHFTPLVPEIWW